MTVTLKKSQGISLKKSEYDLSQVTIGLGWDVKEKKSGFFEKLLGDSQAEYDLDVIAFLCDQNGKVTNLGRDASGNATLVNSDVIFFNSMQHSSSCIWLTGDNRTGAGDGDDEQIIIRLNDLPSQYAKVVFIVQIYKGIENNQSFGNVENAFIRAEDRNGREMVRFDLTGGQAYADCRSMLFAELVRETGGWHFKAIGQPSPSDSFVHWLKQYV